MHYGDPPSYIAEGLIELRKRIEKANIPSSCLDKSLNVATWNLREFGNSPRDEPAIYYIAEILNQFDLIALVELRDNLSDLKRVMDLLGTEWRVFFTDYIMDDGGNRERLAFLYDTRMVVPTGLVAEANPPRAKDEATLEWQEKFGWWRAPYMASFRAGNFDFVVVSAHIRWASTVTDRIPPLRLLGQWIETRRAEAHADDTDFILMGDFNIPSRRSSAYRALTNDDTWLKCPTSLLGLTGTNLSESNTYDQILHSPTEEDRYSGRGGKLDFYCQDWKGLYPDPGHRPKSASAFTFQMSDHLPLWLQVKTDIMNKRLQELSKPPGA